MLNRLIPVSIVLGVTALLVAPGRIRAGDLPQKIDFNRDIRPILSDKCFACHGPDKNNRKAELRLDQAGNFDADEFVRRIVTDDEDVIMPPPTTQKKLSAAQQELLKRWVAEGAAYGAHWSFVRPVKSGSGASIDDFIRAELPKHGLKPSPRAEQATLVRRVALDLTGLPPTLDEQQQFASADSYEEMVDHFLAKPAFGEHMAVAWLDAARYADTNGYQVDRDRELWPWRDWVVRAFNANMPFDQFTIEQLAGDLLPDPTLDQRIATGFHRNHMLNEEGGIIEEEFLAEYTADRVETTAAVWLGQTFSCCRCHDHKYDPFTQRDFYAMKAYFHNVPERGVGNYSNPIRTNAPPFIRLPAPEYDQKIATSNAQLKLAEERMKALASEDVEPWSQSLAKAAVEWTQLESVLAVGQSQSPQAGDRAIVIGSRDSKAADVQISVKLPAGKITALRIECSAPDTPAELQWREFSIGAEKVRVFDATFAKLIDKDHATRVPLTVAPGKPVQTLFEFERPLEVSEIVITLGLTDASTTTEWRFFATTIDPNLLAPDNIVAIGKNDPAKRSEQERAQLVEYRLSRLPEYQRLREEVTSLRQAIAAAEAQIPTTLVMEERSEPRTTFILMRGAYDKPGEQVTAATPEVLPKPADDLPKNRLGLARWLVSPENPLTARVTVNRFWQQFFGTGLVRSSEDFGAQGDLPSHPELLDWLAVTFQESGWDVKRLIKLIIMSETYRQSSRHPTDASGDVDPANVWLARGPRDRLSAEVIRDQALAASGLLVPRVGGPAVKPYHPPGLYEQVVAQRDNPQATYKQGQGEDLFRRSLYTYWKRSVPHPAMMLFDAPFREVCAMRRTRSNTPLQALNLLNDPTYVEASRFLAQRMVLEGGASVESRITHGFRLLLARPPSPDELTILVAAVERDLGDFRHDEEAAKQLLAVGDAKSNESISPVELAAFAMVASTLLNLDETITKE